MGADSLAQPSAVADLEHPDVLHFVSRLRTTFSQAAQMAGSSLDRFYRLGGFVIQLRFAGDALIAPLTRALEHLTTAPVAEPHLTVSLWDSTSTHTPMPPPAWQTDDYREQGKIRGFFNNRIHALFQWSSNALSVLDSESDQAFFWVKCREQIPSFEMAMPLRAIFHLWLSKRNLQLVHAAAVGFPDGGVLLAGKAGVGKSSAALACLASELLYAADDFCVIAPDSPPTIFSLYNSAKTNSDTLKRFPFLAPMLSNPERGPDEKALYFLNEHLPAKMLASFPLRAILVPSVTGQRDTTLRAASPSHALAAIAPSTMLQLPGTDAHTLRRLAQVARQVPCYFLELGTDPAQIPTAISSLLRPALDL